jgi:xanthine dehydrogenase accessory factor
MSMVASALLAAGSSLRLGQPKQLLRQRGEPLVRRAMQQLMAANCQAFAAVVGYRAEDIATALSGLAITRLDNPAWDEGIASSLRVAVAWAQRTRADALLIAVCDQPRLSSSHLDALLRAQRSAGGCVASGYAGTCGVPAILDRSCFDELLALRGDRGAASVLRARPDLVVVDWPEGAEDVDTAEDALRFGLA